MLINTDFAQLTKQLPQKIPPPLTG
ncbi:MAG: hypothetical protein ACD_48C00622G0006, partial [uncultured bacterium]